MNTQNSFRWMALALLCGLSSITSASVLGDLKFLSGHGEPLRAEVDLLSVHNATHPGQIKVRVPPLAKFQQFNLQRAAFLDRIQFSSVKKGAGFLLKLSSPEPLPMRAVDLLLEFEIDGKRVLEYHGTLQPATGLPAANHGRNTPLNPQPTAFQQAPQYLSSGRADGLGVGAEKHHSSSGSKIVGQAQTAGNAYRTPLGVGKSQPKYIEQMTPTKTHYAVQRGDTLFKIAARQKFTGVTTEQMVFALHKTNPTMLSIDKIDQLSVGQRLQLPTANQALAVSSANVRRFKQAYLKHWQIAKEKRQAAAWRLANQTREASQRTKQEQKTAAKLKLTRQKPDATALALVKQKREAAIQLAKARRESSRLDQQELGAVQVAQQKQEAARLIQHRRDAAHLAQQKRETARLTRQRRDAARLAQQKRKASRLAQEKRESARLARQESEALIPVGQELGVMTMQNAEMPVQNIPLQQKQLLGISGAAPLKPVQLNKTVNHLANQASVGTSVGANKAIKPAIIAPTANVAVSEQAEDKMAILENRLRRANRLLTMEKRQHEKTKRAVKEKNRLIWNKDKTIRTLQVGDTGNDNQ